MHRHPAALAVDLDQGVGGVQLQFLADIRMRHRVQVALVVDVIVDVDLDRLDCGVAVGVGRQRLECGTIDALEGLPAMAGQCLERTLIEFDQQGGDGFVQLRQREEGLMAQPGEDQHAFFAFIFRILSRQNFL